MLKLFLLSAFLFFPSLSFALVDYLGRTYNYTYYRTSWNQAVINFNFPWNSSTPIILDGGASLEVYSVDVAPMPNVAGYGHYSVYNRIWTNCSAGFTSDSYGICAPDSCVASGGTFNISTNTCVIPPLSTYDGDRLACSNHSGWTLEDKCLSKSDFETQIQQNRAGLIVGTGLFIGGALMTAAGVVGLPFTFGSSGLLINAGVHSFAAGALYLGFNNTQNFSDNSGNMGSSVTAGGNTVKIDLTNYNPSDASVPAGQIVTVKDDAKNRISETVFVPKNVVDQMADASKVDFVADARTTPLDLTGTIKSNYDYSNNTVTTNTQVSPTQTKTEISPFSITQDFDGSVIATPVSTSSAPIVSTSGGGSVVAPESDFMKKIQANYRQTSQYFESLATGQTPAVDINNTAPVDSNLKASTDILSKLDEIKNAITSGSTPTLSDGSDSFGSSDTALKGSYTGFIYTDPLGLNTLAGCVIPSYGFTLYGRHFVLLDQAMIDQLPLELMRNLFLFLAALAGLISVLSGV